MSFSEMAQLKLFLASQSLVKERNGFVVIKQAKSEITGRVISFDATPDEVNKSNWLQQTFANVNGEKGLKVIAADNNMRQVKPILCRQYASLG